MFIGHLPAGYLLTQALVRRASPCWRAGVGSAQLMAVGMIASVLPDLDLLYFYLIDARQHLHHGYWSHIPFFWVVALAVTGLLAWLARSRRVALFAVLIFCNVQLHLVLDTIAGKIRWLYPFRAGDVVLVEVAAVHRWWVLNFLLHWTFLLELLVVAAAALVLRRQRADPSRDGKS
jgi:inner membrane protein